MSDEFNIDDYADGMDFGFNIVWDAAVSQDQNGWYVEMRIPYAALRFPESKEQEWGIQFLRQILDFLRGFSEKGKENGKNQFMFFKPNMIKGVNQ
mgnify:CR=1 FL=1